MAIISAGLIFIIATFFLYNWLKDRNEDTFNPLKNVVYIVLKELKHRSGFENFPIKGTVQNIKDLDFYGNFEVLQFFAFLQLAYLLIMLAMSVVAPPALLSSLSKYFLYMVIVGALYFVYTEVTLVVRRKAQLKNERWFAFGFALVYTIVFYAIFDYFGMKVSGIRSLKENSREQLAYLSLWLETRVNIQDLSGKLFGFIYFVSFLRTFFKFGSLTKVLKTIRVINQNLENQTGVKSPQIESILKKYRLIYGCFYAYIISNCILFINQVYLFKHDWLFLAHCTVSVAFYFFIAEEELNISARESAQLSLSFKSSLEKQSTKSTKKSGKMREAYEYTKLSTNHMFLDSVGDALNTYVLPLVYLFMLCGFVVAVTHLPLNKSLNYNGLYNQHKDLRLLKDTLLLSAQSSTHEGAYIQDYYSGVDVYDQRFTEANVKYLSAIVEAIQSFAPYCFKLVYLNMITFETIAYICLLIFILNIKE